MSRSFSLKNVSISLDGKELLTIDGVVEPGEILTIMGPSGSGKSSLLAYIAGFLDPAFKAEGKILLDDIVLNEIPPEKRKIGLLFQDALLFPHMNVGQNLCFALPDNVTAKNSERQKRVETALQDAGLEDYYHRDPATLSGGQKSRIALMRSLLAHPDLLLLDEPFSKLDTKLRDQIRQFVFTETRKRNLPVLMVSHDEEDAKAAGGKIIQL